MNSFYVVDKLGFIDYNDALNNGERIDVNMIIMPDSSEDLNRLIDGYMGYDRKVVSGYTESISAEDGHSFNKYILDVYNERETENIDHVIKGRAIALQMDNNHIDIRLISLDDFYVVVSREVNYDN